jgi:polyhydroxybutyrate depolymerase
MSKTPVSMPLLVLVTLTACSPAWAQGGSQTFEHDGLQRRYRYHAPADLPSGAPLVIVMHGYGGSSSNMLTGYGWTELADEEAFAVCFPDGTQDQWNNRFWSVGYDFHADLDVDDTGFIVALAEFLQLEHDLNPEHTFASGLSNGGDMSFQLGCMASETFHAIGPVVGTMMESLHGNCTAEFPRPVIAFNGTDDDITLYEGDMDNSDGWGAYESTPNVIALWSTILETSKLESTVLPDLDPTDGSRVELDRHWSTEHDREVRFHRVVGGGHDWPGAYGNMDVDATVEIWNFFKEVMSKSADPADLNQDGVVDGVDLSILLGGWNKPGVTDIDRNGITNGGDLTMLLGSWSI